MTVVRRMKRGRALALSVVGVLLLVLLAEILWNFIVSPRLVIRKITLESDLGLTDGQLLEMLNLEGEIIPVEVKSGLNTKAEKRVLWELTAASHFFQAKISALLATAV